MKKLLLISLHDVSIDPREKFSLESVTSSKKYDALFLGIGEYVRPLLNVNAVNLPNESVRYRDIFGNILFIAKYRKDIEKPFIYIAFLLLPVAFILKSALNIVSASTSIQKSRHTFKQLSTGKMSFLKYSNASRVRKSDFLIRIFLSVKSYLVDSKNLGSLIRLTWNIHFHLIHKSSILVRYALERFSEIDVLHANDFETSIAALILKKRYGSRLIYDSQEFFPDSNSVFSSWEKRLYSRLDLKFCHKVDAVVSVTPQLGFHMKKTYGLKEVFIIPNAYKLEHRPRREKLIVQNKKLRFIFQGNFSLNRGLETLVVAWKSQSLSEVAELHLVGPDNRHKKEIIRLTISLDLFGKGVFFPEAVLPDHLVYNLESYDIGVIPYPPIDYNFKFCCPNKLGQYMAAGIAVMSNELPFVNSLIEKASCGFSYKFNDEKSIAETVMQFCNAETLSLLKGNSKEFYEEVFNWKEIGQRFLFLYQSSGIQTNEKDSGPLAFIV